MKSRRRPATNFALLLRSVLFRTKVVDMAVGMFIALLGIAMVKYPGGTWWDRGRQGHRFWENYLCDLLHARTLSGQPNLVGSRLALLGMLVLVGGLVAAFSLAPEVIPTRRQLGRLVAKAGATGALAIALSPLLPSDQYPLLHPVAVLVGGLPALTALTVFVGAILLEPVTTRAFRALSLGLLVLVVVAMALYAWEAFLHGPSLRVLPGIARIANLTLLLWLLILARFTRYRLFAAYIALAKRRETLAAQP